ncbi:MAG TPA: hypothetical protein PLQ56_03705 [Aggregatilineales bacterium]|nr:hypothetical protein [Aggregatilineales bacterium]
MLKQLSNIPLIRWMSRHPRLAAWIALSVGMVVLLLIEARDVGLLPGQWIALIAATVLVAGACVWIISWEDEDELVESTTPTDQKADTAKK